MLLKLDYYEFAVTYKDGTVKYTQSPMTAIIYNTEVGANGIYQVFNYENGEREVIPYPPKSNN